MSRPLYEIAICDGVQKTIQNNNNNIYKQNMETIKYILFALKQFIPIEISQHIMSEFVKFYTFDTIIVSPDREIIKNIIVKGTGINVIPYWDHNPFILPSKHTDPENNNIIILDCGYEISEIFNELPYSHYLKTLNPSCILLLQILGEDDKFTYQYDTCYYSHESIYTLVCYNSIPIKECKVFNIIVFEKG